MALPKRVFDPPFRVTRTSHVTLTCRDLAASVAFYTQVAGLVVTAREGNVVFLRGMEEACHHSLVLKASSEAPVCERIGFRVLTEDDLERAKSFFDGAGLPAAFVERPHQGRTLHVQDAVGTPVEFCATMDVVPRMLTRFDQYAGGGALRLDHYQLLTPHVARACDFYASLGFMLSEYMAVGTEGEGELAGVFMQRKGNPHDIVFFAGPGPKLHHFAYLVAETHNIIRACDVAGVHGYGDRVERGPSRHGPSHALFVYFRDPDGHRVELFNTHYQVMDAEIEPVRWDVTNRSLALPWGFPARKSWFEETTAFAGVPVEEPAKKGDPYTLEKYLGAAL